MGTIYKRDRKSGGYTYYGDVWRHGKRQQVSLRTSNLEVAKARLRDIEFATTHSGPHVSQKLGDALDWYTDTVCATKPDGTRESYKQKARHLTRVLGEVELDSLTKDRVLQYIATRKKEGAHEHSIHKELVVLRGTLRAAKERTPPTFQGEVATVVPRFETHYEPRRTFLTPEQFMQLSRNLVQPVPPNAKQSTIERSEERRARRVLFCMMIAFASPRLGELHKMRWDEHVDMRLGLLRIPKGKTVSRAIKIAPVLQPWLQAFGERAGWCGPIVDAWGSCRRDLKSAIDRANAAAAAEAAELGIAAPAKIPYVTPNDLRRTFASWLVQARESLFVVATLLGHSSTRMVELVYGRLDERTLASAVDKLPGGTLHQLHAGVTVTPSKGGEHGAGGAMLAQAAIVNSVEESLGLRDYVVPRVGIEPTTRGFSVRCSTN
jgi:integrase